MAKEKEVTMAKSTVHKAHRNSDLAKKLEGLPFDTYIWPDGCFSPAVIGQAKSANPTYDAILIKSGLKVKNNYAKVKEKTIRTERGPKVVNKGPVRYQLD